jgi:NTE family protein
MRRALVLSSGGAKASWQVGACEHLIVERGYWFDVITGVSAGAVNGATLAQAHDPKELAAELAHLRAVWLGIRNPDVYRRRWRGALDGARGRWASLYDTRPLRGVLERHIDPLRVATSPIRLRVGYVDLLSGQYRTAGNDHPALADAVLASCSLPLLFPPTPLANGQELGVDGAVRTSTPLSDALTALAELPPSGDEPDEVWVVVSPPRGRLSEPPARSRTETALRSLDRLIDGLVDRLIDGLFARDLDRADGTGVPSRPVNVRVLHPREKLRGPSLGFDPERIQGWYDDGLRTAREVSAQPAAVRPPTSSRRRSVGATRSLSFPA